MRKYIVMVISIIILVLLLSAEVEEKMQNNKLPKFNYQNNDITVELHYDNDLNGIIISFYNNLEVVQYVPKFFMDILKKDATGKYIILNGEISITSKNVPLNYIILRVDINETSFSLDDCYEMQPHSVYRTKTYPIDKIIDVNELKNKEVEFQYNGRFGKSNIINVVVR